MKEQIAKELTTLTSKLKKSCEGSSRLFSLTNYKSIEKTTELIDLWCRSIRELKPNRGQWPQFCREYDIGIKLCHRTDCMRLMDEDKRRKIIPFMYTYLEKIGIMYFYFGNADYFSKLGRNTHNLRSRLLVAFGSGYSLRTGNSIPEDFF